MDCNFDRLKKFYSIHSTMIKVVAEKIIKFMGEML